MAPSNGVLDFLEAPQIKYIGYEYKKLSLLFIWLIGLFAIVIIIDIVVLIVITILL